MPISYGSKDELDHEVYFVLYMHKGEENAVLRWDLVIRIFGEDAVTPETKNDKNKYDRAVRDSMMRLRMKYGHPICNRGNGSGYYVANSREEYDKFIEYYLGADKLKYLSVKMMDEVADRQWGKKQKPQPAGQVSMFEVA